MNCQHLVRVGQLGHIGYFQAVDALRYARGLRVICRTARGLEVGHVLGSFDRAGEADGTIVRGMTTADELLVARLQRHRDDAFQACRQFLDQRGLPVVLLDVEQLFDGHSLFFYFLGQPPPELDQFTSQLAETYAANVRYYEFETALTEGCGPGCGTEDKSGCGTSGSCATCAVASACRSTATR